MKRQPGKLIVTFFLTCLLVGIAHFTHAQQSGGSLKATQLSDQQLLQLWQQTQKSGMSENEAIKQLVRKGLPAADVNSFKKRLVQLQSRSKSAFSSQSLIKDTTDFLQDSSWIIAVPQIRKRSPYYGLEFFSNPEISFEPNFNQAPPKNYILGPGDLLTVSLTGVNETTVSAKISREGNYQIPYAGIVNLSGLTLDQATQRIRSKMKLAYPALSTGSTQLLVTIDNVKTISITIAGEAEKPGTYTVSALAGFFNVLYLSGGPTPTGSLRKIELIRNNQLIETIDFYEFLQKGLFSRNTKLENQDIIRFPVYQKRVSISGEVKRPAIYELMEKETLADLIRYAGGLGDTAYKESVKVVQLGDKERKLRDIAAADFSYFIPRNADSVYIEKIPFLFTNRVILNGAVKRPGEYELVSGLSVSGLIRKADGLLDEAFSHRGYLSRRKPGSYERELISFDITRILSGAAPDITLVKEDSVRIFSRNELEEVPKITIGGSVRMPGSFQFKQGMSLEDVILLAGGFSNDAATHKVEISRLEKNKSDTLANKLIDMISVEVDAGLTSKTPLQPEDQIFVPRLLNYRNLGNIKIRGEVLYSGDYPLERRDESVQELIKRAGGVTPNGSFANTQVYRNKLRVAATMLDNTGNEADRFLLLPGDSIFIPRNESFVEVKGEVFNQQIFRYDSRRFLSYISDAGGTTDKANLRKAYIQYSNGVNKQVHHFLFFRKYPKVYPGSRIFVPEKNPGEKKGLSIFELSALTGILTAVVSMVSLLKK